MAILMIIIIIIVIIIYLPLHFWLPCLGLPVELISCANSNLWIVTRWDISPDAVFIGISLIYCFEAKRERLSIEHSPSQYWEENGKNLSNLTFRHTVRDKDSYTDTNTQTQAQSDKYTHRHRHRNRGHTGTEWQKHTQVQSDKQRQTQSDKDTQTQIHRHRATGTEWQGHTDTGIEWQGQQGYRHTDTWTHKQTQTQRNEVNSHLSLQIHF